MTDRPRVVSHELWNVRDAVLLGSVPVLNEALQINATRIDYRTDIKVTPTDDSTTIAREDEKPFQIEVNWNGSYQSGSRCRVLDRPVEQLELTRDDNDQGYWHLSDSDLLILSEIGLSKFLCIVGMYAEEKQYQLGNPGM